MEQHNQQQKPKVAFLCVHNSCRSQMAEALGKKLASDVFESYSAGTEPAARINAQAVRLMQQVYGIQMEESQYNKPLSQLPPVDIVVTMGCNVQCPTAALLSSGGLGAGGPQREGGQRLFSGDGSDRGKGAGSETPHPAGESWANKKRTPRGGL